MSHQDQGFASSSSYRSRSPSPVLPARPSSLSHSPHPGVSPTSSSSFFTRRLSWSRRSPAPASSSSDDDDDCNDDRGTRNSLSLSPSASHFARAESDSPPSSDADDDVQTLHISRMSADIGGEPGPSSRSPSAHYSSFSQQDLLSPRDRGVASLSSSFRSSPLGSDDDEDDEEDGRQPLNTPHHPSSSSFSPTRTPPRPSRPSSDPSVHGPLNIVRQSWRRLSVRAAVSTSSGPNGRLDGMVRLPDEDDLDESVTAPAGATSPSHRRSGSLADTAQGRFYGKTLCLFGSQHPVRRACAAALRYSWTEPIILCLIVANVVVLTFQGARSLDTAPDLREDGFFRTWEDYALFVLFILFTLEMFARIIVSGFIFEPSPVDHLNYISSPVNPSFSSVPTASSHFGLPTPPSTNPKDTVTARFRRARVRLRAVLALQSSAHRESGPVDMKENSAVNEFYESSDDEGGQEDMFSIAPLMDNSEGAAASSRGSKVRASVARTPLSSRMNPPNLRKFKHELPFQVSIDKQRELHALGRPYLRHSWHRVDMLAIVCFWVSFGLAAGGVEITSDLHLFIFRALSVLRVSRLLVISSGTATILRSLKRAAPLLANVAFFVLFAFVCFSIIGVQSFAGSYRRTCVYIDPSNSSNLPSLDQSCGGWYDNATYQNRGFLLVSDLDGLEREVPKGFICPPGQMCVEESDNLTPGMSFDNVLSAAMQVVIIASANTYADAMYSMAQADHFAAVFYFLAGIIVLNFWFSQLFVAVVTNVFGDIRSETKKSAFSAASREPLIADLGSEDWSTKQTGSNRAYKWVHTWYERTQIIWPVLALASLTVMATRTVDSPDDHLRLLNTLELAFSIAFLFEMIIRFVGNLPDVKGFFVNPRNGFDLVLSLVACIIIIPPIANSEAHGWLTIFPLARWYRVILVIPRMRPLLLAIFGSVTGLLNMTFFLFLIIFIAALVSLQLFQGVLVQDGNTPITFGNIYNAFLGMYQIFSSENWTDPTFDIIKEELPFGQGVIAGIFLAGWFLFSNFIILQMFVAVISENFDIAEEEKRKQQIEAFVKRSQPKSMHSSFVERFNAYRFFKGKPKAISVNLPPQLVLPLKKSIVRDFYVAEEDRSRRIRSALETTGTEGVLSYIRRTLKSDSRPEVVAMRDLKRPSPSLEANAVAGADDIDRQFDFLATAGQPVTEEHVDAEHERRAVQADFIAAHPSYDRPLWIFGQDNIVRQFCQRVTPSSHGERIFGRRASPTWAFAFKMVIFAAVIASVCIAAYATPLYRKNYYAIHNRVRGTWFNLSEVSLAFVFVLEFIIKIIADGFIFTPNAYLLNIWNCLDFLFLAAMLVNTTTSLMFIGGLSRLTRSLKAVRPLRLITLSASLRRTLEMLASGAPRILDAIILVILYIIPYAVWGINLFSGKLFSCNNDDATGRPDCIGEYLHQPLDDINLSFPVPQVWANPTLDAALWNFDSFRRSILILFEIISLEGWIDVMDSVMNITKEDLQPAQNVSSWNALFMLFFNLFGAVIILTLFISIIISHFSSRSGSALLTTEQRQWLDLKKTIYRQTPAKRPKRRPSAGFRSWCFDRASQKHGWWSRSMTATYVAHIIALMTQSFANNRRGGLGERIRNYIFLGFITIYTFDLSIRAYGLGWRSFRQNGWNLFDLIVISGSFGTSIPILLGVERSSSIIQFQKLFLVSIVFKLVQKLNSLNQLFKTAVASLPAILNLFGLWACFFIYFGLLDLEIFGLTKWGNSGGVYENFRDFGNTIVMLSFMSTGEGWNSFMHDYTLDYPRCTKSSDFFESDCGSEAWAIGLFFAWNVLSMYLFVNMFTGVVVESFSYVFRFPGKASLTREDIRGFKKTWAEFDQLRTGYIRREQFERFFSKLGGVFEVRPYPPDASVKNLLRLSEPEPAVSDEKYVVHASGRAVDVRKLASVIKSIDSETLKRRRMIWNRLISEAVISDDSGKGISFNEALILVSHYTLINDDTALQLEDLLKRRVKTDFVTDLVNLDRVHGLLRTIVCRRRFLHQRHEQRIKQLQGDADALPSIVVNSSGPTSPSAAMKVDTSRSLVSDGKSNEFSSSQPSTPTMPPLSPGSLWSGVGLPDSPGGESSDTRRGSDVSFLSLATGVPSSRSRPTSPAAVEESSEEVLAKMTSSPWGAMMTSSDDEDDDDD